MYLIRKIISLSLKRLGWIILLQNYIWVSFPVEYKKNSKEIKGLHTIIVELTLSVNYNDITLATQNL